MSAWLSSHRAGLVEQRNALPRGQFRKKPYCRSFGDANLVREMTYVSDVIGATVTGLEALFDGPYNVGSGARATANKFKAHTQGAHWRPRIEVTHGPAAEEDMRSIWADLEGIRREHGYWPWVGLEQGAKAG